MMNPFEYPPPCKIDMFDQYSIVLHIRDLINMGSMLEMDYEAELVKFQKELVNFGWSLDNVVMMLQRACFGTIYEAELPHMPKERGDWYEYQRNQYKYR